LIDGDETLELFDQLPGFQNNCIGHRRVHCVSLLTTADLRLLANAASLWLTRRTQQAPCARYLFTK